MLSFIVPAHNEEACLAHTLAAIHESARTIAAPYEVIVVDDASTDQTAEIARQHNARVVSVQHRQIAATRNSGGRAATGDRLFFIDADTTINARVIAAAMRQMDRGAAGGGALVRFADRVPLYATLLLWWMNLFARVLGVTGGACMFSTKRAFDDVGGFNERLFGAEDAAFGFALKRVGPFVVVWPHVLTSGRRARGKGGLTMVSTLLKMAFFPKMLTQRAAVEKVWYDSDRASDSVLSSSLAMKLSNAALLVIVAAIVSGPIWLLPWPEWIFAGPLGTVRFVAQIIGLHFGLILWPCAYFLLRVLRKQTRWPERLKLATLLALCLYLATTNTRDLINFWAPPGP